MQPQQTQQQLQQPPALEASTPHLGQVVMALPPTVNAQWQQATVVINPDNPSNPIIQFGDNTQYLASQVQVSAPVMAAPAVDPAAQLQPAPAPAIETLRPEYAQFRAQLTELYANAIVLFKMPLDSVISMAHRMAHHQQLEATGKMDVIDKEGIFVPDTASFERFVTAYLEEVQHREAQANGPEA